MKRKVYESDLSDAEWKVFYSILLSKVKATKKQKYELREIANALYYIEKTGCQWAMLPHDFPPYKAVWYHYSRWKKLGIFEAFITAQTTQTETVIVDCRSVKTCNAPKDSTHFDNGKKNTGL